MATLEDRRSRRHPARQARCGSWAGAFGQTAVHALDLPAACGRSRRLRVATSSIRPPPRWASTVNYLREVGLERRRALGLRGEAARRHTGPSGRKDKQPMSAWARAGIARIDGKALGEGEAGLLLPAGADGPRVPRSPRTSTSIYCATTPPNPTRWRSPSSRSASPAAMASSRRGRPGRSRHSPRAERRELQTLLDQGRLRRRRSTTSASAPRPRRQSRIFRARRG